MEGVASCDKPKIIYYPALQFPSALWSILASFSTLFWFHGLHIHSSGSVSPLSSVSFTEELGSWLSEKLLINQCDHEMAYK